jgi:uncharacterized RDD family membrane protein YckC
VSEIKERIVVFLYMCYGFLLGAIGLFIIIPIAIIMALFQLNEEGLFILTELMDELDFIKERITRE